jgi:hypothetical protein
MYSPSAALTGTGKTQRRTALQLLLGAALRQIASLLPEVV